ncbi:MAG: hypothetical protein NC210_07400 [[Clostridium] fimetarium]|nr:hypothetical protein [Alistipes timonensis]MCM1406231.1 hypothetical protein [[Clostridium] fimetarium]
MGTDNRKFGRASFNFWQGLNVLWNEGHRKNQHRQHQLKSEPRTKRTIKRTFLHTCFLFALFAGLFSLIKLWYPVSLSQIITAVNNSAPQFATIIIAASIMAYTLILNFFKGENRVIESAKGHGFRERKEVLSTSSLLIMLQLALLTVSFFLTIMLPSATPLNCGDNCYCPAMIDNIIVAVAWIATTLFSVVGTLKILLQVALYAVGDKQN